MARCRRLDRAAAITGDAEHLPLRDGSIELIFANLLLPWCDPGEVFREASRVLRNGGLLLFTTVGPDTLGEVRQAWSEVDDGLHVHGFADMHDLGDLANRAGLAEPVLDIDRLTVTYPDVGGLVSDLRAWRRHQRGPWPPVAAYRTIALERVPRAARVAANRGGTVDRRRTDFRSGLGHRQDRGTWRRGPGRDIAR